MTIEDIKERYHHWMDLAKTSEKPTLKKAAKYMAVKYKKLLEEK